MRYQGGKVRQGKKIAAVLSEFLRPSQCYVEPFIGMCGVMRHMTGKRYGADINPYTIAVLRHVQEGGAFPRSVSKEDYEKIKAAKGEGYPDWLVGFVGFACSFSGRFFSNYDVRRSTTAREAAEALERMRPSIWDVTLHITPFETMPVREGSLIYCDPPYAGTRRYAGFPFDRKEFFTWCRKMRDENGCEVFLTEFSAPYDFESVAAFGRTLGVGVSGKRHRFDILYRLKKS